MTFDFDSPIERRNTESVKWRQYGADVLPMWVADMDFRSPEPVIRAIVERAEHGVFGYAATVPHFLEAVCAWLDRRFRWQVTPDQIVVMPGVVAALNSVCRMAGEPGDGVLVQTPVYSPFLSAPSANNRVLQTSDLPWSRGDQIIHYGLDFDSFEASFTPRTRLFILCHPHNPTGYDWCREELERMAEICSRRDVLICSDEIHADLLLGDTQHIPTASLSPEIADRCITMMAPSKTFNVPGLGLSLAIVSNPDLRRRLKAVSEGVLPLVNIMGYAAAEAAYREGDAWLDALRAYLAANRDAMVSYIVENMPRVGTTVPEATYLAWLDCRELNIDTGPYEFFLKQAKVALSNGAAFGVAGEGFVRLNFGCPRAQLMQALERMRDAVDDL